MTRPFSPLVFVAIFLFVVIAIVLMFAVVLGRQDATPSSTPRMAMALQLALLQDGDAAGLRLTFTERLRGEITAEAVEAARPALGGATLETLIGTVEEVEAAGEQPRRARVTTPDGRPLTTLVLVGTEWQADTLWFR